MDKEDSLNPLLEKQPGFQTLSDRQSRHRSVVTWFFLVLAAALPLSLAFSFVLSSYLDIRLSSSALGSVSRGIPETCDSRTHVPIEAPKQNLWDNVDQEQAIALRKWLADPARGFNLTKTRAAIESDNMIFLIEDFKPPKQATLRYLSGKESKPKKYARVVIHHGGEKQPSIGDYVVGPLPITDKTTIRKLTEVYANPDISYNARTFFGTDVRAIGKFMGGIMSPIAHITQDLFGGEAHGRLNDTLVIAGQAPVSYDGTWRRMWHPFKLNVPGSFLHPIDFYIYVDMTGTDTRLWKLLKVVYNHQVFDKMEDFVAAYDNGTLKRSPKPEHKSEWATRTREGKGQARDLDNRAGPRSVMFDGPRFRADVKQRYITWMGWSFYLSFAYEMGTSLWDINFRGERIIYELSPQEAMAQYSGNDPHQAGTVWLDRAFGMGNLVREMMVGYDCPADALYLPATIHADYGSSVRLNAICVFERDSNKPLSRHTAWLKDEMGAIKGYELVVRTISTVGNYDYLFDYTFQLDGSLEIRVSASGYLQGGVYDDQQNDYGHRLRETTMGTLHDHVLNYKVDFDIAGQKNSLVDLSLELEERKEPWFMDEDWGESVIQQKFVRKLIGSEDESKREYHRNGQGVYAITNEDEKNSWGVPRGYAIHPGNSPVHLTNLNAKRTEKNVEWAKHHISFTRHKDEEQTSSSLWNMNLPGKPPVDFNAFFNSESLDQEDLVAWINLGTHHIVRSEDSPQTLTNLASSSVLLTPYNYNDHDVSMEILNSIILNAPETGNVWDVAEKVTPQFCLPPRAPAFNYTGLLSYEENGKPSPPGSIHEMRMRSERQHAVFLPDEL